MWYSSSKKQGRIAMAAMRLFAGHGKRRFGRK